MVVISKSDHWNHCEDGRCDDYAFVAKNFEYALLFGTLTGGILMHLRTTSNMATEVNNNTKGLFKTKNDIVQWHTPSYMK